MGPKTNQNNPESNPGQLSPVEEAAIVEKAKKDAEFQRELADLAYKKAQERNPEDKVVPIKEGDENQDRYLETKDE